MLSWRHPSQLLCRLLAVAALFAVLIPSACGSGGDASGIEGGEADTGAGAEPPLEVLATTTEVADLVANVAGGRVEVTRVLEPNADPHGFEPRPSDVSAAADAEIVFTAGLGLDAWSDDLIEGSGSEAALVDLSQGLPRLLTAEGTDAHGAHAADSHADPDANPEPDPEANPEATPDDEGPSRDAAADTDHAHPDDVDAEPHWWHDPRNAIAAVRQIAAELSRADPAGRDAYRENARRYAGRIERLDREIAFCLGRLGHDDRELITDHDAIGYFADRYGLEAIGAVLPAQTAEAQSSARDLRRLAARIERDDVKAIFPVTAGGSDSLAALAAQTGATADEQLHGDSLGEGGSGASTYLEMMVANAAAIARGLSGGTVECDRLLRR